MASLKILLKDHLEKYIKYFEAAGYGQVSDLIELSPRERQELVLIIASDMAADGTSLPEIDQKSLIAVLNRLPSHNTVHNQPSATYPTSPTSPTNPTSGKLPPLQPGAPRINRGEGGLSEDDDLEALMSGIVAKDTKFETAMCCAGFRCHRIHWIFSLSIFVSFMIVSLVLYALDTSLRDDDHEAEDKSLAGAWLFARIISYIGFSLSGICCLSCMYTAAYDPQIQAIARGECSCDPRQIQCDCPACCDCQELCIGLGETCQECFPSICDPDRKPCCYTDPDAPPFCCAPEARFFSKEPGAGVCFDVGAPCCPIDPSKPTILERLAICCTFDCADCDCPKPDFTCNFDCLPEDCCSDVAACCSTCFKICTCQFKLEVS